MSKRTTTDMRNSIIRRNDDDNNVKRNSSSNDDDTTMIGMKIQEYTKFVQDVLRPDYTIALQNEQMIRNEIIEYESLITTIQDMIMQNKYTIYTPNTYADDTNQNDNDHDDHRRICDVDLGYGKVSCRAKKIDLNTIYVHIGMGFHIECTINHDTTITTTATANTTTTTNDSSTTAKTTMANTGSRVDTNNDAIYIIQQRIQYLQTIVLPYRYNQTKHIVQHIQNTERILNEITKYADT